MSFLLTDKLPARVKYLKPILKGKVLNIGCTFSPLHNLIEKNCKNIELWGIDIIVKENKKNIIEGNALKMPFKSNEFDCLIGGEILEHFYPNQAQKFLSECYRVLKLGGELIITTPNKKGWTNQLFHKFDNADQKDNFDSGDGKSNFEHGYQGHVKLYVMNELVESLKKHGFAIIHNTTLPYTEESSPNQRKLVYLIRGILHNFMPQQLGEELVVRAKKSGLGLNEK